VNRTSSPEVDDLGFLLARASQRFDERLVARLAERGFPEVRASYGSVLVPLFAGEPLRPGELGARARLSKQSMTGLVKRCEEAGLVGRERDPADGRAHRIVLTARGRALQAVAEETLAELDRELVARLGTRNRDVLVEALRAVMEL
jgi:MarR family transcriptional regulator, organic hydroperoxide resistance regulator